MNPRVEKAAMVLQLNRDQEGTELWVGMYDLWADYRALLEDYNAGRYCTCGKELHRGAQCPVCDRDE